MIYPRLEATILIAIFITIMSLGSFEVFASGYGGYHGEINTSTIISNNSGGTGVALGIAASQHNFDMSTKKTQISVAVGQYDGDEAVSFAAGKRVGDLLVNGSIGSEGGKQGMGAGIRIDF